MENYNYNSQVVARNSHNNIVGFATNRLRQYENVILGNDDDVDDVIKNNVAMYKELNSNPIEIFNSLAIELQTNKIAQKATHNHIKDWIMTALRYDCKFGSNNKMLHILEFTGQLMLYFGYEAYQAVAERILNSRIVIDLYTYNEMKDYYKYHLKDEDRHEKAWVLPQEIPVACRNKNIATAYDIFGFRIDQIHNAGGSHKGWKKTTFKHRTDYMHDKYIESTKNEPMWQKWTVEMAKKRILIQYVKEQVGLKDNRFLEMMNFELSQEKNVGLAN
ncbi:MAG: hypothetical protein OEZ01_03250 [Candidatus Heimdallarchaeota archaeon]|nr:hypothetical protein [Candidatus Heimdallarchaeota archaeon]